MIACLIGGPTLDVLHKRRKSGWKSYTSLSLRSKYGRQQIFNESITVEALKIPSINHYPRRRGFQTMWFTNGKKRMWWRLKANKACDEDSVLYRNRIYLIFWAVYGIRVVLFWKTISKDHAPVTSLVICHPGFYYERSLSINFLIYFLLFAYLFFPTFSLFFFSIPIDRPLQREKEWLGTKRFMPMGIAP